ncbi:MAG: EamA family transporter [Clostridia bacterium]|nr:EamA family transporter [Clostridia bacterium]
MSPKVKMLLSTASFGTIALFVRHIPLTSAEVALFRAIIALLFLGAFKALRREPLDLSPLKGELGLLFLSGAAVGFNWIFLFEAYRYTTVSVATLSYYFAPVLVTIASPILFREKLTRKQILCFAGATAGLVLVINPGAVTGSAPVKGVFFGLAAAVLYASVILLNKKITRVKGIDRTALQFAAAAAVLIPYVLLTTGIRLQRMDGPGWACLLAVGLIHSGAAYLLYFSALAALPGQEAAILSYVDPLVAVVISLVVLREPVTGLQLVGGAMILAFTLANELGSRRRRRRR